MKLYEELADVLASDIRSGAYAAGARLPSIRTLVSRYRINASTAFGAYYLLEEKGLVRARPRSGYYVTAPARALPAPLRGPVAGKIARVANRLDVSDLVFEVLNAVQDPAIVPLGSAFAAPALFPLQSLGKSLARAARLIHLQGSAAHLSQGAPLLRQQIALRYLGLGISQPADELIVTSGALEGLNLCLSCVAQPGDLVAVESPGFYAALQTLERLRMKVLEIPVLPEGGLDLGALAAALKRHPVKACWFMTSFQNPTGTSMPEANKKALVELLSRHEIPLIEDDAYGELYFGNRAPLPAKAFDRKGLVMHCGSFSKSLAPGYRVGWVSPGRFGERIERLKLMTTLSASLPAQLAVADYLQRGGYDRHLRRLRHAMESHLSAMQVAIARYFPAGIRISQPAGGYFLWVEFEPGFDALLLYQRALAHGISVAPGPVFSARRRFGNCLRLNYGHLPDTRLDAALQTLGRLICLQPPYLPELPASPAAQYAR
ncbi:MAG: PLP-dependent aminotransferase family protein [Pseudomonadota bacterium]